MRGAGFSRWLLALAISGGATYLSVLYVDRPAAEFFDRSVRHTIWWGGINGFLAPLVVVPIAAVLFLLVLGCWLLAGRQMAVWTLKPVLCCWSVIWALGAELVFKQIFGRAWPDPTYIGNHLYGFRFFHGHEHWNSFPSGTATIALALVATLWHIAPRVRSFSVCLAVLLLVGVVVTNGHWISDVIAGAFLGWSIGWMTVLLHQFQRR